MTEQELIEIQNRFLESAKQNLMNEGFLISVCFILTTKRNITTRSPDRVREVLKRLDIDSEAFLRMDPDAEVCLVIPTDPPDEELANYLLSTLHPMVRDIAEMALSRMKGVKEEDKKKVFLRGICARSGMHRNDIIARMIQDNAEYVSAFAVIKIDDAYGLGTMNEDEEIPVSLKDAKGSQECIMSVLDSYGYRRLVTIPYHREGGKRDEGKVTSFDEPHCMDSKEGSIDGKFSSLLPKLETPDARA